MREYSDILTFVQVWYRNPRCSYAVLQYNRRCSISAFWGWLRFHCNVSVETRIVSFVTLLSPSLSHVLQKRRIHCRIPPPTAVTARYYDPVVFTVLISHSFQRQYNERILLAVGVWCNWLWFGPHALSIQFEGDLQGESTWHHAYHDTTSNA